MPPRLIDGFRRSWRSSHALVLIPLALIVAVSVIDDLAPQDIHLGPLLVAAPTITASFAGARLTALIGALAVAAQLAIGVERGVLGTANITAQASALVVVTILTVIFCLLRDRRARELTQVRSVAEAAQQVLLQPLPSLSGPLEIATLYRAADAEAELGGDLYAAARTWVGTRLIIGDVRGKGLTAIGLSALVLGAFRAAAHRQAALGVLVEHLDGAVHWDAVQWRAAAQDKDESFVTAVVLDIPDHEPEVRMVNCGHPAPLLLSGNSARALDVGTPAPPLGLGELAASSEHAVQTFTFEAGDTLLLYTDGVIEARDPDGSFYPLAERAAAWSQERPEGLLNRLEADLRDHTHGRLADDVAAVAIHRRRT
ncbi:PP2C family protein-serine/threonine phosphatase [Streptacidiphilus anmyonensis]|uniref:PP2C family protein-serine/threonine phosphatase n=1 Tax=Streptacidiphilus anmyonensis TaxID=405782 RepID=UPI0005A625D5|nr:PP2C family protein-serine/threonine phosphatase [Streptacidiphilus anmyonensis]